MAIPTPPATPNRQEAVTFSQYMDAYLSWITNQLVPGLNTISGMTTSGLFSDGSAGTPSGAFAADTDTGFWRPANNIWALSTGGSEAMRVNASNLFFFNCVNAIAGLGNPRVNIQSASSNATVAVMRATADANPPNFALVKSRGAANDDYAIVQNGDSLGNLSFYGADGATPIIAARISSQVMNSPVLTDVRGQLNFATGNGAGTVAIRLTITDTKISASLPILNTAGGVGYDTGAGGTVTQATNRTTGVTLNKLCGEITMFSAAGSATPASFVVTDSQMAATDNVILNVKSGATNVYNFAVTAKAAGSFTVTYWTTGGTATDAPVLCFEILKGANS